MLGFITKMMLDIQENTQIVKGYELNLYDDGRPLFLYNIVTSPTVLENVKAVQSYDPRTFEIWCRMIEE